MIIRSKTGFVAAGFTAIKLSPSAAHVLEQGLAQIGIHARVWVDPSDLWALTTLPTEGVLDEVGTGQIELTVGGLGTVEGEAVVSEKAVRLAVAR